MKHDICLAGYWYGENYGSILNGYAVTRIFEKLGKKVLLMVQPGLTEERFEKFIDSKLSFIKRHYKREDISPILPFNELHKLSDLCDCFCVGSDQLWNYHISLDGCFFMPFVGRDKRLISFATSFGPDVDRVPARRRDMVYECLHRYDAISVREKFAVDLLKKHYNVDATAVLEPVFCIDKEYYFDLAGQSKFDEREPYILAYILDPTEEKKRAVEAYAKKMSLKTVSILDYWYKIGKRDFSEWDMPNIFRDAEPEDFCKAFLDASYIITDSFHGTAFSIIFNKPFVAISNKFRGKERFYELLGKFSLTDRLIEDEGNIPVDDKYLEDVDFTETNIIIEFEKKKTINWLENALKPTQQKMENIDVKSILQEVHNIDEYVNLLDRYSKEYTIVLAICDTAGKYIPSHILDSFRNIGFKNLSNELWRMYAGIIVKGEVYADQVGSVAEEAVVKVMEESKIGHLVEVQSLAWRRGNTASIKIDNVEYAVNRRGVNIVVYDQEKGEVIDSVRYDSHESYVTVFEHRDDVIGKELSILNNNADFTKIRMLATLLRDYGVDHIVLSPGGRDVPIVRMFEYNDDYFKLHRVTDERSAAYFGLGLATRLRRPVACVCTSGTAASNFLPAVTEAYFTGVPLIVITADRYEVYHGQGEDQTIPQREIYKDVVKYSFTLPEGMSWHEKYRMRREISRCILETTHGTLGPVHINVAVDDIGIGGRAPRECWAMLPTIYPHILLVGYDDGKSRLMDWVHALQASNRVMVVYGQNAPLGSRELQAVNAFAEKYDCVILTDYISNLKCSYAMKAHNMLLHISQSEFDRELSPDILITVGGKRLMNDPLTFKVRSGPQSIRHWSISPDGEFKDFYFRLTSVLEMSQDNFFRFFAENAGGHKNNGEYFEKWNSLNNRYAPPEVGEFNANYVQSKFFPGIPEGSFLHLGVGQSFYDCRKYAIRDDVEVYCNMGTNGIDGCTSTFMGQCAAENERLCFLIVGDLSFFYDMNSVWNKELKRNIRILMVNNAGSGLLRGNGLKGITAAHDAKAGPWVESVGFEYISASTKEEYDERLSYFLSGRPEKAVFFEVFCV